MSHEQCSINTAGHIHDQSCSNHCGVKCISWSAIIVGTLVALGLSFLLNLFSVAIGLSIFKVNAEGVSTFAIGGLIGFLIGIVAIMFVSGWITAFLGRSRCSTGHCGGLYGFTMWCLALVVTILLASHVGHFIDTYSNFITTHSLSSINLAAADATTSTVDAEKATNNLGTALLVTFFLFLFGAFASIFGGHCAMSCCKKDHSL